MIEKDYSIIKGRYDELPSDIKLILESISYDDLEYSNVQLRKVKSPFIISDNGFDRGECNNFFEEYNVERVESGTFTGGAFYVVYTTTSTGVIVQGNSEEGYNIFVIEK
jgi:hypothetical protein